VAAMYLSPGILPRSAETKKYLAILIPLKKFNEEIIKKEVFLYKLCHINNSLDEYLSLFPLV